MDLEARIEQLEKQNRRFRWASLLIMFLALAALWRLPRESTTPQELLVRRLMLVDEQGAERAVLGAKGDEVSFTVRDRLGNDRIEIDLRSTGPGITLYDDEGKVRALLAIGEAGPYFGLTDENGDEVFSAPSVPDGP